MKKRIWIVAAGTGGHIFPGLSLAKHLQESDENFQIEFFGSQDRIESQIIPKHGFALSYVSSAKWKGRGPISKLWSLISLGWGTSKFFFQSLFMEKPSMVFSVGGYVSLPVVLTAAIRKIPIVLMEPNIKAGLANRLASRFARFAVATPGSDASNVFGCRVIESGVPVRKDFQNIPVREQAQRILVLGGSQGAKPLTEAILKIAKQHDFASMNLSLKLQVGAAHMEYAKVLKKNLSLGEEIELVGFIDDMAQAYQAADLVIARAGALTVAELASLAMPTVFVPYPYAADNHQMLNAELLAAEGAAVVVDQTKSRFESQLADSIIELTQVADSYSKRKALSEAFSKWARPRAADDLYSEAMPLLEV